MFYLIEIEMCKQSGIFIKSDANGVQMQMCHRPVCENL